MLKQPRWEYWLNMPRVKVWEGVALSCGIDPKQKNDRTFLEDLEGTLRYLGRDTGVAADQTLWENFQSRRDLARAHITSGSLQRVAPGIDILHGSVDFRVFSAWALARKWDVPDKLKELAEQAPVSEAFAFDEDSETYPAELDAAFNAWRAVKRSPSPDKSPKQLIRQWLDRNYKDLSNEAKDRISIVCNWNQAGGRPKP